MRVMLTGGTGYVGGHTLKALLDAGHVVRMLVRSEERAGRTFDLHGVDRSGVELVVGDVTDAASVADAVQGADAAVHAASVYSFSPADAQRIAKVNMDGMQTVLPAAVAAGCSPVIHVSSTVAIQPTTAGGTLTTDNAPTTGAPGAYIRSKAEQEAYARQLQADGAPVVITYPGGVFGPIDPYEGEQAHLMKLALRGLIPVVPRGGAHYSDVRDVAAVHVAVLTKGVGPRRYIVPGHFKSPKEELQAAERAAGRRIRAGSMSPELLARMAGPAEALMRRTGIRYPATRETMWLLGRRAAADTERTETELNVHAVDFDQSVRDTLQSMLDMGQLKPRLVPALHSS